jgi:hypothetical protein
LLAVAKPGACIINVSRGGVIDDSALIDAPRTGRVGARPGKATLRPGKGVSADERARRPAMPVETISSAKACETKPAIDSWHVAQGHSTSAKPVNWTQSSVS